MITENINLTKVTAKEGYLLTNGTVTTDTIYLGVVDSVEAWWEIPDPNYVYEYGTYLNPIIFIENMVVEKGSWYTKDENIYECIKDGVTDSFYDPEYFDIV